MLDSCSSLSVMSTHWQDIFNLEHHRATVDTQECKVTMIKSGLPAVSTIWATTLKFDSALFWLSGTNRYQSTNIRSWWSYKGTSTKCWLRAGTPRLPVAEHPSSWPSLNGLLRIMLQRIIGTRCLLVLQISALQQLAKHIDTQHRTHRNIDRRTHNSAWVQLVIEERYNRCARQHKPIIV